MNDHLIEETKHEGRNWKGYSDGLITNVVKSSHMITAESSWVPCGVEDSSICQEDNAKVHISGVKFVSERNANVSPGKKKLLIHMPESYNKVSDYISFKAKIQTGSREFFEDEVFPDSPYEIKDTIDVDKLLPGKLYEFTLEPSDGSGTLIEGGETLLASGIVPCSCDVSMYHLVILFRDSIFHSYHHS